MKRYDCKQGTAEWHAARLGIPTASCFNRIVTPKRKSLSTQAEGYLNELIAERFTGVAADSAGSKFMERGTELEPEAVAYYEMVQCVDVDRVGFCVLDDRRAGCSPDGLVGLEGGLEIKCLSAANHVALLRAWKQSEDIADDQYQLQVQGAMWITGRQWWDRLWYNPKMESIIVSVQRDDEVISLLSSAVLEFAERVETEYEMLNQRKKGNYEENTNGQA